MKFWWKKIKEGTEVISLKEQFLETVSGGIKIDGIFVVLLVFSTVIATLGLLTNSAAVVIGAMLISPLAWPCLGLAASVTTTRKRLTQRSFVALAVSVAVVIVVAMAVTYLVPGGKLTSEIRLRTDPTLLDLFVALASAVIGVLAVYYPAISASMSGVAVSVALLPPLCVTGIGLAWRNWEVFNGSLLLFAANLGAIVFAGALTLYFLGFKPRREVENERFEFGLLLSSVFIVALSIPLAMYFWESVKQEEIKREVVATLEREVKEFYGTAELESVTVGFGKAGRQVEVKGTVFLAEGDYLTVEQQNELITKLAEASERNVDLQLNLVNTLVLRREEDENIRRQRGEIEEFLGHELERVGAKKDDYEIRVMVPGKPEEPVEVKVSIKQSQADYSLSQKQEMLGVLEKKFGRRFELELEYVPVTKVGGVSQVNLLEREAKIYLEEKLAEVNRQVEIVQVSLDLSVEQLSALEEEGTSQTQVLGVQTVRVKVLVYAPEGFGLEDELVEVWETELAEQLGFELALEFRVIEYRGMGE